MRGTSRKLAVCLTAAGLVLVFLGCPRQDPDVVLLDDSEVFNGSSGPLDVNKIRGGYSLEPTGILVRELEAAAVAEEAVAVEAVASAMAVASEEAAEGEVLDEETAAPEGPRSVEVMIDLLVRFDATGDALPGITVEVVQNDPFQEEKNRHLTWVETPGLRKGEHRQVEIRLEVDNYEDGDEFSVEWNAFVPPEKRADYREFAEAAP